jgi:hypothetical protein
MKKNHDQEKIIPSDENKPIQEITESQEVGQKMDHINLENENN